MSIQPHIPTITQDETSNQSTSQAGPPPIPSPPNMQIQQARGVCCIQPDATNLVVGRMVFHVHPAFHPDGDSLGPAMPAQMVHTEKIEKVVNRVVHPVTKEMITKYQKLMAHPILLDLWEMAMYVELGRLACPRFLRHKGNQSHEVLDIGRNKKNAYRFDGNVCTDCCELSTPEEGPQPGSHHSRG